jgi:hypothetical protein
MESQAIASTKEMISMGLRVSINPCYLDRSKMTDQQNRSLLGQRTLFLDFQRFMYSMSNEQLDMLKNGYQKEFLAQSQECPNDNFIDMSLMIDSIQLQIALRDDKQADPYIRQQIAISFRHNARIAKDFAEITSEHLINLANKLIEYKLH